MKAVLQTAVALLAASASATADYACCAGRFVAEGHGAPYPPTSAGEAFDFYVYSTGANFSQVAKDPKAVIGSVMINGRGHWSWSSTTSCVKWDNFQQHPNYCFGPGTTFPTRLSDVQIGGAAAARWTGEGNPSHVVYTTPPENGTCHPVAEQGFRIPSHGGTPDDSVIFYNVKPLGNPPADAFEVPSFCPQ